MVDKRSAPAFSIGHSTSTPKIPTSVYPGPGAYDAPSTLKNSKLTTAPKHTEPRFRQQRSNSPGPGAYNPPEKKDHVATALILSRNKEEKHQLVPGPGAYQPDYRKIVKSESGFKIGSSEKIADLVGAAKKLPGPGNYEVNTSTVLKDHAARIGSERRSDMVLNKFTPGPGQYNEVKLEEITRNAPKMIFGKSGRSLSTASIGPGPGSYAYNDKFQESINKTKGFSMSSKHPDKALAAERNPGPGAYNVEELDKLKHKIVAFSVGKSSKLKIQNQKELLSRPGPEKYSYKLTTFDARASIFGKERRATLANENHIPGPGAYSSKLQATIPQFSIPKSKTGSIQPSSTPGPGTYEPKLNDSGEYHSIKLPQDARKPFYNQKKGIPGPGAYEQSPPEKHTGFKIGNEKRGDNKAHNIPGPGNYNIPSTISNLPKYSH